LKTFFAENQLGIEVPNDSGSTTFMADKDSLKDFDWSTSFKVTFDIEEVTEGYSSGKHSLKIFK
jgi:hypothetical protein